MPAIPTTSPYVKMPSVPSNCVFWSSIFPPLSLSLSEYGGWSHDGSSSHAFVIALSKCLALTPGMIKMVTTHGLMSEGTKSHILDDLNPLCRVCDEHNIPFELSIGSYDDGLGGEIQILCTSLLSAIQANHLISFSQLPDLSAVLDSRRRKIL